ncbi:hypothetical protein PMIN03_011412 [Paraphaeosphaeria minitans]
MLLLYATLVRSPHNAHPYRIEEHPLYMGYSFSAAHKGRYHSASVPTRRLVLIVEGGPLLRPHHKASKGQKLVVHLNTVRYQRHHYVATTEGSMTDSNLLAGCGSRLSSLMSVQTYRHYLPRGQNLRNFASKSVAAISRSTENTRTHSPQRTSEICAQSPPIYRDGMLSLMTLPIRNSMGMIRPNDLIIHCLLTRGHLGVQSGQYERHQRVPLAAWIYRKMLSSNRGVRSAYIGSKAGTYLML